MKKFIEALMYAECDIQLGKHAVEVAEGAYLQDVSSHMLGV